MAKNFYIEAPEVERMAQEIIGKYHTHLIDQKIEYVFRSEPKKDGNHVVLGTARKISGLNAFLANVVDEELVLSATEDQESFFVVEIWHKAWKEFDDPKRRALVDHELCHCLVEENTDDNGNNIVVLSIRPHDVEEFTAIIDRHGLWRRDLADFFEAANKATRTTAASNIVDDAILNVASAKPTRELRKEDDLLAWAEWITQNKILADGASGYCVDFDTLKALAEANHPESPDAAKEAIEADEIELYGATFIFIQAAEESFRWPGLDVTAEEPKEDDGNDGA